IRLNWISLHKKHPVKQTFTARVNKIGINPYVFVPPRILDALFRDAGRNKSPIPVLLATGGQDFHQNLVRYQGEWRLYLNTPMRSVAGLEVGDKATIAIAYDSAPPVLTPHPHLVAALKKHPRASAVFRKLTPSLQKEIIRYI